MGSRIIQKYVLKKQAGVSCVQSQGGCFKIQNRVIYKCKIYNRLLLARHLIMYTRDILNNTVPPLCFHI